MALQVKSNLELVARERGKIVGRRKGHNLWLNVGRTWLSNLISYSSFDPLTAGESNRISYMGFGIGGELQGAPAVVNNEPMLSHYPGTNVQTDRNLEVTRLERPVRFDWASGPSAPVAGAYAVDDVWLKQVDVPTHPTFSELRLRLTILTTEMNDAIYPLVELSEIGLFDRGKSVNVYDNAPLAYDTFANFKKTADFDITVTWTIRF